MTIVPRIGRATATTALCVALLTACFHGRLAPEPVGTADLSGTWVLDATRSDDADKAIRDATPAPPPPSRPGVVDPYAFGSPDAPVVNQRGGRGGRGGSSQADSSSSGYVVEDSGPRLRGADRALFVRSVVLPTQRLTIEESSARVLLVQADRRREFEPGMTLPHSVTDRYGSRDVRAGWRGRDFVVEGRDHSRVQVDERWALSAPDTLVYEVTLKAWNYRKIHVRSIYRRAGPDTPPPPPVEGPVPGSAR